MSNESPFVSQVTAVSPLDGDAIDGSVPRTARKPASAPDRPTVRTGRKCPICGDPFYDPESFGQHVWDETPSWFEKAAGEREHYERIYLLVETESKQLREQICVQLEGRPWQTLPELAAACGRRSETDHSRVRWELNYLVERHLVLRRSRAADNGNLRRWRYALTRDEAVAG